MNPPSTTDTLELHRHYCDITGLAVPYSMQRHYVWEKWLVLGFQRSDLDMVVRYIRRRINDCRREKESLLFRNLIANPENFGEDLAMAKSEHVRRPTERDSVLRATGRPAEHEKIKPTVKSAEQVMGEHAKMAALLKEWRGTV